MRQASDQTNTWPQIQKVQMGHINEFNLTFSQKTFPEIANHYLCTIKSLT